MRGRMVAAGVCVMLVGTLANPAAAAPNDPFYDRQWGLHTIGAEEAWALADGSGALIAVVDTGVDLRHPDLAQKIVSYPDADMVEPNGSCTGGNGSGKGNSKNRPRTCIQDGAQDENGHGTHVAGIAAAITGNGEGVAGVAPGASILPVRVLDADGSGTTEDVAAGIRFAADRGADVINLSLGFLSGVGEVVRLIGGLEPIDAAIEHAVSRGAVVIVAAGNDGFPLCAEPSAYPEVICVGASDLNDLRSWFSNSDVTMSRKFLLAPGGDALTCASDIFSTYLRGEQSFCGPDGYEALAGTSMATPHVAGVAALLAGQGFSRTRIETCILDNADDLGIPGPDPIFGYGRLNAHAAVANC